MIALVVRTQRPFFRSRPGRLLLVTTLVMILLTPAIPYMPFVHLLGFVPVPGTLIAALLVITVLYVVAAEVTKLRFYRADPGCRQA